MPPSQSTKRIESQPPAGNDQFVNPALEQPGGCPSRVRPESSDPTVLIHVVKPTPDLVNGDKALVDQFENSHPAVTTDCAIGTLARPEETIPVIRHHVWG